ncbi:MAG TPA: acyl-CoA dehydrogenase family protein [Rhodanobacteraceae bacterium]
MSTTVLRQPHHDLPADAIADYAGKALTPLVDAIDREGFYPRDVVTGLGRRGGFGALVTTADTLPATQLHTIEAVGRYCGSTAFIAWCQSASAWYLAKAPNAAPRERFLAKVLAGTLPAGSGMSNFLKHYAGIEKIRLTARRDGKGYRINGILPWVSNLDRGHLLLTAAGTEDGGYIMVALPVETDGLALHPCPAFSGMEGTNTWNIRMNDVFVPDDQVLAHPDQFADFMTAVKPALILTQVGMGLGLIAGCIDILDGDRAANKTTNAFLDDDADTLRATLARLHDEAAALAVADGIPLLPVLRLRAQASEWALRAAQSTALRVGARGYLMRHPAQRRLREALFVAIVTPALKHLRKEIADAEQADAEAA